MKKSRLTQDTELLIASHITSWSKFENNRLNPRNGLCLNALHDKAFDGGLLTISAVDYNIKISSRLLKQEERTGPQRFFLQYQGKKITITKKFSPSAEFLELHNKLFKP